MIKNTLFYLITILSIVNAKINFSINGDFSNFYAMKTIDNEVLNIPFRLLNVNSTFYINNFELKHTYSVEYTKIDDVWPINFNSNNFNDDMC